MTEEPEVFRAHRLLFDYCNARFLKKYTSLAAGTPSLDASIKPTLSDALYTLLRGVLVDIVAADLELFKPSRLLYYNLDSDELPEPLKKLAVNPTDRGVLLGYVHEQPDPEPDHQRAYRQYCERILTLPPPQLSWWQKALAWFNPPPPQGINALFLRHPNAQWLLDTITDNFIGNLSLCLQRVRADRKAIEACFLGGQTIQKISHILVTDSDPHKGGKQVVILTFTTNQGTRRVVYKPSDIEIDYRIAGKNTPQLKAFLEQKESATDKQGYPQPPYQSLYEWADTNLFSSSNTQAAQIAAAKRFKDVPGFKDQPEYKEAIQQFKDFLAMPTYVILPRNPGSRLVQTGDTLPIQQSYGYIEYLDHEPANPPFPQGLPQYVLQQAQATPKEDQKHWDWITDQEDEIRVAYRLWGRLIATAVVFLQTDLHISNQRFHKRKPHLIDLESCLVKPVALPSDTMISDKFNKSSRRLNPGDPTEYFIPWMFNAANHGSWMPIVQVPVTMFDRMPAAEEYSENQLYYVNGDHAQWARLEMFDHTPAQVSLSMDLIKGVAETMRLMKEQQGTLKEWVNQIQLGNVVVRHVIRPTTSFVAHVQHIKTQLIHLKDGNETAPDQIITNLLETFKERAASDGGAHKKAPEFEALEWNGVDYLNLDVPAHYRRVGSLDLIASSGRLYKNFYDTTGLTLLERSFEEKLPTNTEAFGQQIKRMTAFAQKSPTHIISLGKGNTRRRRRV